MKPRGKALHYYGVRLGWTERPPGSNSDTRSNGIRAAQRRFGLPPCPWCGCAFGSALIAGGVRGVNSRVASVALIEDDAKARRGPYRWWNVGPNFHGAFRGDGVVLFGRGVHVEILEKVYPRLRMIRTRGGNTSSGTGGSQSNGGGYFRRWRRFSDVHGVALVDYPNK